MEPEVINIQGRKTQDGRTHTSHVQTETRPRGGKVKRHRKGRGTAIVLMVTMFFVGLIAGALIIHYFDQKHEAEAIENLTPKVIDESIHVYFPKRNITYGQIPRNSYNPENFTIEDGFRAYYDENGEKISHVGVDLSYHNQSVKWDELAASPVEFVMLRCGYRGYTEGGLVEDEKFRDYAQNAMDHGLKVGVYFFTQAISVEEAVSEADFVIKMIEDYDISYPVAFDTEYVDGDENRFNQANLSKEELTDICIAFCERIKEAGYYPMVYASENWFRRKLNVEKLTSYDFWAPQYLEENDFLYDFTMWQYTESGSAPGIDGPVDINISMVDYSQFVPALKEAVDTGGEVSEYDAGVPSIQIAPVTDDDGNEE